MTEPSPPNEEIHNPLEFQCLNLPYDSRTAIQILPSAILLRKRLLPKGIALRIAVQSHWANQFLEPYQDKYRYCPAGLLLNEEEFDKTALLKKVHSGMDWTGAAKFAFVARQNFWGDVGFPQTSRGRYQRRLWLKGHMDRYKPTTAFVAPNDLESVADPTALSFLWKEIMPYLAETLELPVIAIQPTIPPDLSMIFAMNSVMEPCVNLWEIVTHLLHCKVYIGANSWLCHLADLLGLPCVIVDNSPVKPEHAIYKGIVPVDDFQDFCDALRCLERVLLS